MWVCWVKPTADDQKALKILTTGNINRSDVVPFLRIFIVVQAKKPDPNQGFKIPTGFQQLVASKGWFTWGSGKNKYTYSAKEGKFNDDKYTWAFFCPMNNNLKGYLNAQIKGAPATTQLWRDDAIFAEDDPGFFTTAPEYPTPNVDKIDRTFQAQDIIWADPGPKQKTKLLSTGTLTCHVTGTWYSNLTYDKNQSFIVKAT
jgi:hypothetical protein